MRNQKLFASSRDVNSVNMKSSILSKRSIGSEKKVHEKVGNEVSSLHTTPRGKKQGIAYGDSVKCDEDIESDEDIKSAKKNSTQPKHKAAVDKETILDDFVIGEKKTRSFILTEPFNEHILKNYLAGSKTIPEQKDNHKYKVLRKQVTEDIERIKQRSKLRNSKVTTNISKSIIYKTLNKRCGGVVTLTYYNTSNI